jgi:hypothetical protein
LDKRKIAGLLISFVAAIAREEIATRPEARARSPNSDVSDVKYLTRRFRDWAQRMSKESVGWKHACRISGLRDIGGCLSDRHKRGLGE